MCLDILKPKHPDKISEPKIAKKDIVCYKVFRLFSEGRIESPYQNVDYELKKKKKSNLVCYMNPVTQSVNIGIHSFIHLDDAIDESNDWSTHGMVVVKCVIPKGAKYYTGVFGLNPCRASSELIPIEIIHHNQ